MARISKQAYSENVFINCPFDADYDATFQAIVFCVIHLGFRPRCALEIDDGADVRIEKLFRIISECRFGIHDLSRTQLDADTNLPRFNMPLELGMFLAAGRFGSPRQQQKTCLILDSESYRYQAFISDIAGQDIRAHHNTTNRIITIARNWLRTSTDRPNVIRGAAISRHFEQFSGVFPEWCREAGLEPDECVFADYAEIVSRWLSQFAK